MFLTNDDKLALLRDQWLRDAVDYMVSMHMYEDTEHEKMQAHHLAESLFADTGNGEWGFDWIFAQDAVDEELTYWGD